MKKFILGFSISIILLTPIVALGSHVGAENDDDKNMIQAMEEIDYYRAVQLEEAE